MDQTYELLPLPSSLTATHYPALQVIKRNQMMVLQALAEKEAALLLYNDPQEQAERKELIEAQDHIHHPRGRLVYHMELVGLLSQCCTGKNAQGEMLVRELLPLSDLVQQCLLPELTPALRANYMLLLDEAYLDTDKHQKEVATGRVSDSVAQGPTALTSPRSSPDRWRRARTCASCC